MHFTAPKIFYEIIRSKGSAWGAVYPLRQFRFFKYLLPIRGGVISNLDEKKEVVKLSGINSVKIFFKEGDIKEKGGTS